MNSKLKAQLIQTESNRTSSHTNYLTIIHGKISKVVFQNQSLFSLTLLPAKKISKNVATGNTGTN